MDILIKSFNRPYYLARCIQSIYDNVLDEKIAIVILDDGTPLKYLAKIQANYPDVQFKKSAFYQEKSRKIETEQDLDISEIPVTLWLEAARNASDYFLLLEDDIWLTKKINLKETQMILESDQIYFLKLFWLTNSKLIHGTTKKVLDFITIFEPLVFTKNPYLHRLIFGITRFGNRKIMKFLKLYSNEKALNYYSMYGVAGAVFSKKYFLSLWENHKNVVDENLQLKNAVKFWHRNPEMKFARTTIEYAATGFSSSATNKSFNPENFDVFTFNKLVNEAWFNDELDVMKNLPEDLDASEINNLLMSKKHAKATLNDWRIWVTTFKKQFQDIGCSI